MTPAVAYLVHYSGMVQGVGFRATTRHIAQRFAVAGWIRNLPDGRVEMHVEGAEEQIAAFLGAVRDFWSDSLEDVRQEPKMPTGKFGSFDVVR